MSQLALYRKYRSQTLQEVVGQTHITETLSASLKSGNISHAYLFTGPRGVGKTTIARILAYEINHVKTNSNENFLDIIEIDAASNRGIDEIRALREKVAVAPTTLKYKVYIIDEAHMLTREAFNALLKTLEEPPAHVVFILATTEAHKLPATIISRTQRYDFSVHSLEDIAAHLKYIANKEGIKVEDEALNLIAEQSDGGMRDAISLLDQLSSSGKTLTADFVSIRLSLVNKQTRIDLLKHCSVGDKDSALAVLSKCFQDGHNATVFTNQLIVTLRSMLYSKQSELSTEFIIDALKFLQEANFQSKNTTHTSLPLEIAIATLALAYTNSSQPQMHSSTPKHVETRSSMQNKPKPQNNSQPGTNTASLSNKIDDPSACAKGLSIIKDHNNSLYALLRSANAHINGDKLQVDCRFKFHKDRIEENQNRSFIEKVMSKATGRPIELNCQLAHEDKPAKPVNKDTELVNSAMAILGGELVDE